MPLFLWWARKGQLESDRDMALFCILGSPSYSDFLEDRLKSNICLPLPEEILHIPLIFKVCFIFICCCSFYYLFLIWLKWTFLETKKSVMPDYSLSKRRLLLIKEAMQITKWVALACSSGPDNSLQYSNCFLLDANTRRTLKHTSGVLDDQKCFDGHGFSKKFMWSIYSSAA